MSATSFQRARRAAAAAAVDALVDAHGAEAVEGVLYGRLGIDLDGVAGFTDTASLTAVLDEAFADGAAEAAPADVVVPLASKTVAELREIVAELGIDVPKGAKKSELIAAIEARAQVEMEAAAAKAKADADAEAAKAAGAVAGDEGGDVTSEGQNAPDGGAAPAVDPNAPKTPATDADAGQNEDNANG